MTLLKSNRIMSIGPSPSATLYPNLSPTAFLFTLFRLSRLDMATRKFTRLMVVQF